MHKTITGYLRERKYIQRSNLREETFFNATVHDDGVGRFWINPLDFAWALQTHLAYIFWRTYLEQQRKQKCKAVAWTFKQRNKLTGKRYGTNEDWRRRC